MQAPSAVSVVPSVKEFNVSPVRDALLGLDTLDVGNIFRRRPSVMKSPPKFLCGAFPFSDEVALLEIVKGAERWDEGIQCLGWKLFLLLPRMLLFRYPRGGNIPKQRLVERFASFSRGEWEQLLIVANGNSC